MSKKNKDILTGLVLLILSVSMAFYSLEYRNSSTFDTDVGSNFLPMVCSIAIAVLSSIFIISAVFNKDEAYNKKVPLMKSSRLDMARCIASIVLLLVYVICFRPVGFLLSSVVYLFLQITIFTTKEKRDWIAIIITSVTLPVVSYFLFVHVLNYMLPAGILG